MFTGYSDKTLEFMWGIRFNNNREWFAAHKGEYLQHLYEPTLALGRESYDRFMEKFPELNLNLHVCRIYRDARRLYGRGPYKDHLWFTFRTENDVWTQQPVFWFEVSPDGWSYGVGFWNAAPSTMKAMREDMEQRPERLEQLSRRLTQDGRFSVQGEDYKKLSRVPPSELLAPWYTKKHLSVGCDRPFDSLVCSRSLVDALADGFAFLVPYYQYFKGFCKAGLEDLK